MKPSLAAAATELNTLAETEDLIGVVILADKKTQAIEVYTLARGPALREALERAQKLFKPRKVTN